ncbi:uncharacterized protein [Periplaneta americana]|uniref:uncharacterized protein n=1 Tax=Periplaneta americana TaxID=6978 RepID=UPI0037E71EC3
MVASFPALLVDYSFYMKGLELMACLLGLIYSQVETELLYYNFYSHISVVVAFACFTLVLAVFILIYLLEEQPPDKLTSITFLSFGIISHTIAGSFLTYEYFEHSEEMDGTGKWLFLSFVAFLGAIFMVVDCVLIVTSSHEVVINPDIQYMLSIYFIAIS